MYDPAQPAYLRMNVADGAVDMWWPGSGAVPAAERRSFASWRGAAGDAASYSPRGQVGRYLTDGLARILRHAPPGVRVTLHRAHANDVAPAGTRWRIAADGAGGLYDEVLLAVGHEPAAPAGLASTWSHHATLVPAVFPVAQRLGADRVPPGSAVAVRGFALTFIDAALALTEGRGGSFEALDHPYRLRYVPGREDVGVIVPYSRSGRAMLAKPHPLVAARTPALGEIGERGRASVLDLPDGFDVQHDLLAILAAAASGALLAVGGRVPGEPTTIEAWLAAAAAGAPGSAEPEPAHDLERSLAIGAGLRAPDAGWALGHTWRALYPAIVSRLGGEGLAAPQWPEFLRLAAQMERVAFGPAPVNVAKLLALVAAGRLDLRHVGGGGLYDRSRRTLLRSQRGETAVDVVVDAVLPGPGAIDVRSEPLRGLLERGLLRVMPGRRGLDVDAAGGCRGRDGSPARGLSAIGRATEDVVIGNDTMNRSLHPLADRWASELTRRADADASERCAPHAEVA